MLSPKNTKLSKKKGFSNDFTKIEEGVMKKRPANKL